MYLQNFAGFIISLLLLLCAKRGEKLNLSFVLWTKTFRLTMLPNVYSQYKKVKKSRYRPGVAQKIPGIKVPRFHDNGTEWW